MQQRDLLRSPAAGGSHLGLGLRSRACGVVTCVCPARSYRTLATEHEALMQKYLHLLQIVETEKTVAQQLRRQIEDGEVEIERLKAEVTTRWAPGAPWAPGGAGSGDT